MACLNSNRHYVTKRAEQLQNDYEISKSPKLAEIIRAKNIGDLLSLSSLLRILPQLGATELNYVRCAYAVGDPEEAERNVIDQCEANGVGFRIFRVSLTHGNQKHKNGPFDHI
jgi:hypothetical protein